MRFLLGLAALFSINVFAKHAQIDCGSTTIGQTYTASSPGLPISGLSPAQNSHMALWNTSATTRICIDVGQYNTTAPSSGGSNEHCIAPNSFFAWDFVTINASVFIRADLSDCTAGIVDIDVW